MYIARLTVISESCVVPLETAGNVMEFYADVVIIDNHSLYIEIDELSALWQCAIEKHWNTVEVGMSYDALFSELYQFFYPNRLALSREDILAQ